MRSDDYRDLDFTDITDPFNSDRFSTDRRAFLKALGCGIFVFVSVGEATELLAQERRRGAGQRLPTDFNAFLRIGEDGRISGFTGKAPTPDPGTDTYVDYKQPVDYGDQRLSGNSYRHLLTYTVVNGV